MVDGGIYPGGADVHFTEAAPRTGRPQCSGRRRCGPRSPRLEAPTTLQSGVHPMRSLVIVLSVLLAGLAAACARSQPNAPTAAAPAPNSVSQPAAAIPNGRIGGVVQGVDQRTVALQDGEQF